jgi:hypothetical protein
VKYIYLVSKQYADGSEQYETWEIVPKPKYPSIFWTVDDQYQQRNIVGKRLKDVIAQLSVLHPGCRMTKKFETYGDPEWVITFLSEDEKVVEK